MNNTLGKDLGSGIFGALVNFATGTVIVGVIQLGLTLRKRRRGQHASQSLSPALVGAHAAPEDPPLPPFQMLLRTPYLLCSGLLGATFVVGSILIPPETGFALFSGSAVLGQLVSSLVVDHFGIHVHRKPVTVVKILGIALAATGVILGMADANAKKSGLAVSLCILTVFGGALMPLQSVFNLKVSEVLSGRIISALLSFAEGTAGLGLASLIAALVIRHSSDRALFSFNNTEAWQVRASRHADIKDTEITCLFSLRSFFMQYIGGPTGTLYILSGIAFPRVIGVTGFFLSSIGGQLAASLVFDTHGFYGFDKKEATPQRIAGVVLVFVACVVVQASLYNQMMAAILSPEEHHRPNNTRNGDLQDGPLLSESTV